MESFSEQNSNFTFDECSEIDSQRESLKSSFIKIQRAQKELKSYEILLINKEKSLESRSEELSISIESLTLERSQLEKEKILFDIEKQTFMREKLENQSTNEKLRAKFEKFKVKKYGLKEKIKEYEDLTRKKKEEIEIIEKIKNSFKDDQENIKAEYAKIDNENKILSNNIKILANKKNEIEKLEEKITKMQSLNEKEKNKLMKERENIQRIKKMLTNERDLLKDEIKEAENARKHYEDCLKTQEEKSTDSAISTPANIGRLIEALKRQIDVFNEEISVKEKKIQVREESLENNSKKVAKYAQDMRDVEKSLVECKNELTSFKSKVIPEVKNMYTAAKILMHDLNEKIKELNVINDKLDYDINAIYDIKLMTLTHQEKIENHLKELEIKETELKEFAINLEERQSSMSVLSDTRMDITISELEHNLLLLKQKQEEVDKEALENSKNAEYLRNCIQEIESTKSKLMQEKLRYKEKNNLIELKQKQLTERFKELETFHSSLRKKELELSNIQKQICNIEYLNKSISK